MMAHDYKDPVVWQKAMEMAGIARGSSAKPANIKTRNLKLETRI